MDVFKAPIAKRRDACSSPKKGMISKGKAVAQILLTAQENAISFALTCRRGSHHFCSLTMKPLGTLLPTKLMNWCQDVLTTPIPCAGNHSGQHGHHHRY